MATPTPIFLGCCGAPVRHGHGSECVNFDEDELGGRDDGRVRVLRLLEYSYISDGAAQEDTARWLPTPWWAPNDRVRIRSVSIDGDIAPAAQDHSGWWPEQADADSLQAILADMADHTAAEPQHGPNCACKDEYHRRFRALVQEHPDWWPEMELLASHFIRAHRPPTLDPNDLR